MVAILMRVTGRCEQSAAYMSAHVPAHMSAHVSARTSARTSARMVRTHRTARDRPQAATTGTAAGHGPAHSWCSRLGSISASPTAYRLLGQTCRYLKRPPRRELPKVCGAGPTDVHTHVCSHVYSKRGQGDASDRPQAAAAGTAAGHGAAHPRCGRLAHWPHTAQHVSAAWGCRVAARPGHVGAVERFFGPRAPRV